MSNGHPAFQEEKKRLEMTLEEVERTLNTLSNQQDKLDDEIAENRKEFQKNPDEGSATYINLLTGIEQNRYIKDKITGLSRAVDKPYFARVDFTPDDNGQLEKRYISKVGLLREEDDYPLIIDWRAPIANLYYEGRLGDTHFKMRDKISGEMIKETGKMSLKRQFTIEDGKLLDLFDIDVTTTDPLLQQSLGANADNKLKDIASTIQAEQNRIIRADIKNPLIVQGVAGSGKTTVALHRIAYLIYTYEDQFDPDTFMIIAPNRLFLDYISEVLPELGADRVKQTTLIDLFKGYLAEDLDILNPNQKLRYLVNEKNQEEKELVKFLAKFKGSLLLKEILEKYLNDIEEAFIPRKDLSIDGEVLFTASEIRNIFLAEYKYYPIYKRVPKLKNRLKKMIDKKVDKAINKIKKRTEAVIERFHISSSPSESERQKVLEMMELRDEKVKKLKNESGKVIKDYFSGLEQLELLDYYQDIMTDHEKLELYSGGHLLDREIEFIIKRTKQILNMGKIEFEDLAPLAYLQYRLYGVDASRLSHIIVDEAQDFSLFQYYLLKEISKTHSFTLLGDLAQGIHSYRAITSWQNLRNKIFKNIEVSYNSLEKSYRTTIEIMKLANQIIASYPHQEISQAEPIIRHGQLPQLVQNKGEKELINYIESEIIDLKSEDFESIAIIGKDIEECQRIYDLFEEKPQLIVEDMDQYQGGTMIIPSYLTKGLEFDAVFIVNLEEEYEDDELDIKLLYIAMTRALHRLYLCAKDQTSPLIENLDQNTYQKK